MSHARATVHVCVSGSAIYYFFFVKKSEETLNRWAEGRTSLLSTLFFIEIQENFLSMFTYYFYLNKRSVMMI